MYNEKIQELLTIDIDKLYKFLDLAKDEETKRKIELLIKYKLGLEV